MAYAPEQETNGKRHQVALTAGVAVLAAATMYVSLEAQQRIAGALQASVLAPFLMTQEMLAQARVRADQIDALRSDLDSLTAVLSTQAALVDENRALRDLLGLAERSGPSYLPATVIRPGTPGSESMFFVDVGLDDGVAADATVVSAHGLVGRVREVRRGSAVVMDWTHPDFRAGAMLEDGSAYGLVENVRGEFREEDRLVLNGMAYYEELEIGALVLTSGLGVFPRGIPIGTVGGTEEVEGTWRKSYWLRPSVEPASVTHVLVARMSASPDVTGLWDGDPVLVDEGGRTRDPRP